MCYAIAYFRGKHAQDSSQVPNKKYHAPMNEVAHSSKGITLSTLDSAHLIVTSENHDFVGHLKKNNPTPIEICCIQSISHTYVWGAEDLTGQNRKLHVRKITGDMNLTWMRRCWYLATGSQLSKFVNYSFKSY